MDTKRFKNYGLWVSIFALIPLICQAMGINLFSNYSELVNAILAILVGMGIVNNPSTDNKGFGDDKPVEKTEEVK